MKIPSSTLSDLAYQILSDGVDDRLGNLKKDIMAIEKAELALYFMRALAEGKKRIVFDITRDPQDS